MSSALEENNKALVRRFIEETHNRRNLDVADELLAPNFLDYDIVPGEVVDIEGLKLALAKRLAPFSDFRFTIEEQVAEGEKVVTKVIGSGIHDLKEFRGVAPSGARLTIEIVTINRVIEGKIVEARHTGNTASLWQQRLA